MPRVVEISLIQTHISMGTFRGMARRTELSTKCPTLSTNCREKSDVDAAMLWYADWDTNRQL